MTMQTIISMNVNRDGRDHTEALRQAGYRVIEAASTEEAFRMVEHDGEALLLLQDDGERFCTLADSAPVLVWMNGPDGGEFVNRAYLDFLGVRDVDVRGFDWAQFVHPDDRKGYVTAYLEAAVARRLFEATFRFRRHDGQYRWMKSVGTPRLAADGTFLGYVGSTIDVTELQTPALNSPSPTSTVSDRKEALPQRFRTVSIWLASAAACIAGLVLVGWAFGLTLLTSISSSFMSMKITTAVGFLCSAGSVLLFTTRRSRSNSGAEKTLGIASVTLAVPAVLLGFGTLIGYVAELAGDATHPGWMAQATAGCFVLLGVALMFANRQGPVSERLSQYSALLVLCIAGVALIGYLYNKSSLYAVGPYSSMALHTALSFVFLSTALLCAGPDRSLMATLSSGEPGAVMMRRMLPLMVSLLVLTGWIRLVGEHKGWFDQHFGLTLLVGLNVVGFGMILWSVARSLNRMESALRESKERLQAILNRAPAAIFIKDAEGRSLFMNEYCAKVLGVDARAANGKTEHELFPRDLADQFRANDAKVWTSGKLSVVEEYIPSMEGLRTYLSQKFLLQDPHGTPYALCGIATDITERKQAEATLHEKEKRLRLAKSAAGLGIHDYDVASGKIEWDERVRELWGVDPNEVITYETFLSGLYPDDRATVQTKVDKALDSNGSGQYAAEYRVVNRRDGAIRWVTATGRVTFQEGRAVRLVGTVQDITERKEADRRVLESAAQLKTATGIANLSTYTWDPDSGALQWDARLKAMFGLPPDAPVDYDTWRDAVHPDDRDRVLAAVAKAVDPTGDGIYDATYRAIGVEDHVERWVAARGQTFFRDGRPSGFVGTARDITEQKHAEERLRASEQRFRAVFNHQFQFSGLLTPDGTIVDVSESALRNASVPRERVIGQAFIETPWFNRLPQTQELWRTQFAEALTGERSSTAEAPYHAPDGSLRWALNTVTVLRDQNGKVEYLLVEGIDITERKRAEEAVRDRERFLATVTGTARVGLVVVEPGYVYRFANEAYLDVLGLPPPVSIVGRHVYDVMEKGWSQIQPRLDRAFGGERVSYELTLPPKEGGTESRHFAVSYEPHRNQEDVQTVVVVVMDISKRKHAELALHSAKERLQRWNVELEQAVNEKTAELQQSHARLRAMASEVNLAEQRERKRLATELHDHLQQILVFGKLTIGQGKRAVGGLTDCQAVLTRVDDILSDALTYSRTLVAELCPPVLHDHGLVAGLKWLAEYMKTKQEQTVTVIVSDNHELPLPEDQRILLFQSVRELLINASKHAGTGEATVSITASADQVQIEVRDHGRGFDLAAAAAAAAGTPSGGISSKFGLFSIQERMRALGGGFEIHSRPGQGTAATLILPLGKSPEEPMKADAEAAPRASDHSRGLLSRVLLVDDHIMVRQGLRAILDAYADIELVAEAGDGEEAVRLVEQWRPDVVVMDISMPRLNGIDATRQIKLRYPETIIIGLSVNAAGENQEAMARAGAVRLMTKDAAVEQLYNAIQDARRQSER